MNRGQEVAKEMRRLTTAAGPLGAEQLLAQHEAEIGCGTQCIWYLRDIARLLRMHRDTALRQYGDVLQKYGGRWGAERHVVRAILAGETERQRRRAS